MKYYKQCTFRSECFTTTAWIPEEGAKLGYSMVFKDADDERRWTVTSVGDQRIPEVVAKVQSQGYKHQHKMSDMPRRRGKNKEQEARKGKPRDSG